MNQRGVSLAPLARLLLLFVMAFSLSIVAVDALRNVLDFPGPYKTCVAVKSTWYLTGSAPSPPYVWSFTYTEFKNFRITQIGLNFTMVLPRSNVTAGQSISRYQYDFIFDDNVAGVTKTLILTSPNIFSQLSCAGSTCTYFINFQVSLTMTSLWLLMQSLRGVMCFVVTNYETRAVSLLSLTGSSYTIGTVYLYSFAIILGDKSRSGCATACAGTGYKGNLMGIANTDIQNISLALMTKYPASTGWIGLNSYSQYLCTYTCGNSSSCTKLCTSCGACTCTSCVYSGCVTDWSGNGGIGTTYNDTVTGSNHPTASYMTPLQSPTTCTSGTTYFITKSSGTWSGGTGNKKSCLCSQVSYNTPWTSGLQFGSTITGREVTYTTSYSPTFSHEDTASKSGNSPSKSTTAVESSTDTHSFSVPHSSTRSTSKSFTAAISTTTSSSGSLTSSDTQSVERTQSPLSLSADASRSTSTSWTHRTPTISRSVTKEDSISKTTTTTDSASGKSPTAEMSGSRSKSRTRRSDSMLLSQSTTASATSSNEVSATGSLPSRTSSHSATDQATKSLSSSPTAEISVSTSSSRSRTLRTPSRTRTISDTESSDLTLSMSDSGPTHTFSYQRTRSPATHSPSASNSIERSLSQTNGHGTASFTTSPSSEVSLSEGSRSRSLSLDLSKSSSGSVSTSFSVPQRTSTVSSSFQHTLSRSESDSLSASDSATGSDSTSRSVSLTGSQSLTAASGTRGELSPTATASDRPTSTRSTSPSGSPSHSGTGQPRSASTTQSASPTADLSSSESYSVTKASASRSATQEVSVTSSQESSSSRSKSESLMMPSRSISASFTLSPSGAPTMTWSLSPPPSRTRVPSLSQTFTFSGGTDSRSASVSPKVSETWGTGSPSREHSVSFSATISGDKTSSRTRPVSRTRISSTMSISRSSSLSVSETPTLTRHSPSVVHSASPSRSPSSDRSATRSRAPSPSRSPSLTPSKSATVSTSVTWSRGSPTLSTSNSTSPSRSPTLSPTSSPTRDRSLSMTTSDTVSRTATGTSSMVLTLSHYKTLTRAASPSPSRIVSDSWSRSTSWAGMTNSETITAFMSRSTSISGPSPTASESVVGSRTVTDSWTPSGEGRTRTETLTVSFSASRGSNTRSKTVTLTRSVSLTVAWSSSSTASPSDTRSPPTATIGATLTQSDSFNRSVSKSMTGDTWTRDKTGSYTAGSQTFRPSATRTQTETLSPSADVSNSAGSRTASAAVSASKSNPTPSLTGDASKTVPTRSITVSASILQSSSRSRSRLSFTLQPSLSHQLTSSDTDSSDVTLTGTLTLTPPPTQSYSRYTAALPPPDGLLTAFIGSLVANLITVNCSVTVLFVTFCGFLATVICLVVRFGKDNCCRGRKESKPTKTRFPMWRSLLVLHTYASVFAPCHYRCAFLHTLQLTFHLLSMLLVTGILLGYMKGSFLTIVVISAVAPVVTIPLKVFVNYLCFLWYYDDRDIVMAAKNRERVEVVAQGDDFQFDFYGRRTQYHIPVYRLKKEQARLRRLARKRERVITPELNQREDALAAADFTILPDESAAFYAAEPPGSPREDGNKSVGGVKIDDVEIVQGDDSWSPPALQGSGIIEAPAGAVVTGNQEEVEPVPLDVTIHTYSHWIGIGLGLGSFFLCWASVRAIEDADAAAQKYCTDGSTVNTILAACIVVDNIICEPLYLAATYLIRHADTLGDDAYEGGNNKGDDDSSSSSGAGDDDSSGTANSDRGSGSSSSVSSRSRRRRRRNKRRKMKDVFCDIHPVEGTLRTIYVHPDVDEMFNTVQERHVDEFVKQQQQALQQRSAAEADDEALAGEQLQLDERETLAQFQGFSS